jgi:hypothetical protein
MGERMRREETSGGDPSGGEDPEGDSSGIEMLLGEEEPSSRESESAWFPSCLPLWLSEEGRRKNLSEK